MILPVTRRWTWRTSAHFRLGSLLSAWLVVLAGPWLGALFFPLAALRFVVSSGQMALNHGLARTQPLGPRDRLDWLLLGATFLASCAASALQRAFGHDVLPLALVLVLIPYSVIQLRMSARCYRAAPSAVYDLPQIVVLPSREPARYRDAA